MIRKEYPMTVLRRWQFTLLVGLLFAPLGMRAQTADGRGSDRADGDSTVIRTVLYFSRNNGDWIEKSEYLKVGRFLRWVLQDTLPQIRLSGWTDRTGTVDFNTQLSLRRARTVRNYLVRKGVAAERIRIEGRGIDFQEADEAKSRRVDMVGILLTDNTTVTEETPPQARTAVPATATRDVAEKKPISEDTPSTVATQPQVAERTATNVREQQPLATTAPDAASCATSSEPSSATRYLGVKTNLAAWAGTIMNVAADVQVGRHWSVELPVLWCPWYISDKHAVKTFTIQPEGRYWLGKPGEGHFFGVHAHVGWFNVKWNRDRYQDTDRPLLGAGISYGYLLPFTEHWAGEFTLGAGYANMRYDTYYNIGNGARIDTRTKNYWGITRVGISVVYRFNLKNK